MTMTTDQTEALHRLLDEAFAPYPVTSETLDLKQEVRGNLTARAAELVAAGSTPVDAARRAIVELGDVGILLGETPSDKPVATESWVAEQRRNRVRPKPAYAVRTALLAGVLAVVILVLKFEAFGLLTVAPVISMAAIPVAAVLVGWIVFDALRQETTQNYPFSRPTALAFGVAAALLTTGIGSVLQFVLAFDVVWALVAGGAVVAAIVLFTYLGVTSTNRRKPWALRLMNGQGNVPNAFDNDQATAARFGMYTAGIFTVAFAVFIVLTITIGWAWSWLALVGGFVLMLLVLARMLFPPKKA
jgi:hypothetical protein